jgi:hypothetical protein
MASPNNARGSHRGREEHIFQYQLHHDFPRRQNWVIPDFQAYVLAPKARMSYLVQKLRDLNAAGNSVLFVRNFPAWERPLSEIDIREFVAAVRQSFPEVDGHFLFINCPADFEGQRIRHLRFDDPTGDDWKGDYATWSKELSSVPVSFTDAECKRFTEVDPQRESVLNVQIG